MTTVPFEQRLWGRIDVGDPAHCWEWQGHLTKNGYGTIHKDGKDIYCHRAAYESKIGPIPEGLCACHKCDNRKCCNPSHIFLGTYADNLHDMAQKGRADHTKNKIGSQHGMAKLNEDQVREIRRLYNGKRGCLSELGKQFNVTNHAIYRIVHRKNWKHLE